MKSLPFAYKSYKQFLSDLIENSERSWGGISRLADAAGCQRSYLSRVLSAELHLTPDHLYGICSWLKLAENETEYLLTILEEERASTLSYRERLKEKSTRLRKQHNELQNKVNRPLAPLDEKDYIYYSTWLFSALHILVSITAYQTTKEIASRLQLPVATAEHMLKQLQAWELIKFQKGKWSFSSAERHVPKRSPLVSFHHQNWRQRAVMDAQNPETDGVHFTVVQSMNEAAYKKIQTRLLDLIEEASKIAGPSPAEKLVCFTADFFEV
jgi:uncharacterized protein (TIGR02147 family)